MRFWNGAVVGYLAVVIFLLTLNPFEFQAFVPSEFWVWRFGWEDFLQNILLFFPLGVVVQHTFQRRAVEVMLCGLLLSLSVEACQLFVEIRTSNVVDLTSNATGAGLGALFYQRVLAGPVSAESHERRSPHFIFGVPFAFMLLPFCWVSAMRAVVDPACEWLLLLGAIAGLAILSRALAATFAPIGQRTLAIGVWAIAALVPIFSLSLSLGLTFLITAPIIAQVLSTARRRVFRMGIVALLSMSLGVSLTVNGAWYLSAHTWTWSIPIHLRWIEVGMSAIAVVSSSLWVSGWGSSALHSRTENV